MTFESFFVLIVFPLQLIGGIALLGGHATGDLREHRGLRLRVRRGVLLPDLRARQGLYQEAFRLRAKVHFWLCKFNPGSGDHFPSIIQDVTFSRDARVIMLKAERGYYAHFRQRPIF